MFASECLPYNKAKPIVSTIKSMFPENKVAKNIAVGKDKMKYLIENGLGHEHENELRGTLQEKMFSILVDESTDRSTTQILVVMVRFVERSVVKDRVLDVLELTGSDSKSLFNSVKASLSKYNLNIQQVLGFGADNCSVMMGEKTGLKALLKAEVNDLFVVGCVCHSLALVAGEAAKCLPSWLEIFVKDVASYFSRSGKRVRDFKKIQDLYEVESHKMLKLATTRWLSRSSVITRILEQWDPLKMFFSEEKDKNKTDRAHDIISTMESAGAKHMLLFLQYILKKIDSMNIEFQAEDFRLHKIHQMISFEYKNLLSLYIKPNMLKSSRLDLISPCDPANFLPLEELSLGGRCTGEIIKVPLLQNEHRFRQDCLKFLIAVCSGIKGRFDLNPDGVMAQMQYLDPMKATGQDRSLNVIGLATKFPRIIKEELYDDLLDEWNDLKNIEVPNSAEEPPTFWSRIREMKDGVGNLRFPTVGNFIHQLCALPHSTAAVERVFSSINNIKKTNLSSLKVQSVRGRLLAKQAVDSFTAFTPSNRLVKDLLSGDISQRYKRRFENKVTSVSSEEDDHDAVEIFDAW